MFESLSDDTKTFEWQLKHIQKGLAAADRQEFASEEEVKAAFARWRAIKAS